MFAAASRLDRGYLPQAGNSGQIVGCRIAALDERLLEEQDLHDDGVEIFDCDAFSAGNEGLFKPARAAEDVGGEGEFFGEFATEGLGVALAMFPIVDGLLASAGGSCVVLSIVTGPGGVEGGPTGVGVLFDVGEDQGVAEEWAGFFRNGGIEALALVILRGYEIGGEFVNGGDVGGGVAALRAGLHPEGDGGAEGFAGACVEVGGLAGIGGWSGRLVGGRAAVAAVDGEHCLIVADGNENWE